MLDKYSNTEVLIKNCIKQQPDAQKYLYDTFGSTLYSICLRYTKNVPDAEDLLQETFIKIFQNLDKYTFMGSFEGWLKRLTINLAINNYHSTRKQQHQEIPDYIQEPYCQNEILEQMNVDQIVQAINKLPDGYKMVLNLYAIDGYTHKEIAEMLDISEGTSKSQLSRAKASLLTIISKENEELTYGR